MDRILLSLISLTLVVALASEARCTEFLPPLQKYMTARVAEFNDIPMDRKEQLLQLSNFIQTQAKNGEPIKLTFICTHNSRRSHIAQLWAATAAHHFRVPGVETYSGGTEATAFNPRAVAALERAGFKIDKGSEAANPHYQVWSSTDFKPIVCFSKTYDADTNPSSDFCAVMTCSEADKSCPTVKGAASRLAIPYEDPKVADGTPQEFAKYDQRCAQIAREMLFVFSRIAN